jgi:uncharacterized membrane protein
MKMTTVLLIITAVLAALIAGLFHAYSCSVVLGLGKLSDAEYLRAMQNINREILNPVFLSFMGTAIFFLYLLSSCEGATCLYFAFIGYIGLSDRFFGVTVVEMFL